MKLVTTDVAHPWYCDVLGHMTTRFFLAMFDDASYHFIHSMFGWCGAQDDKGELAIADVRHVIEYKAEVSAGDLLEIRAELLKIGGKSLTFAYEMTNLRNGEIASTLEVVSVLFDLNKRKAVVIPDALRSAAEKQLQGDAGED